MSSDIHPLQNLRVLNCLRDEFGADDDGVARWIERWIKAGFASLETLIERHGGRNHAFGDSPTLADAWLIPQVYNAVRHRVDLSPYPRIRAINEHCLALPEFASALPERQPDAPD